MVQPGFTAQHCARRDSIVNVDNVWDHSGLIHAFSQHLVKTGRVPKELGQSLARAHELRLVADYTGDQVQACDAQSAV